MRKKLLSILALLCLTVSGAWAQFPQDGDTWDITTKTLTVNSDPGENAYGGISGIEKLIISDAVTSIGNGAFVGCPGLTSVTFGNSVTSIGENAFASCGNLTSVTFGNSVTSIGENAFYECSGLTSITIPNSVTSIGDGAFRGCIGLTSVTIGNSVTSIGNMAFVNCTGLTSITIPSSVTSIGDAAFGDCSNLETVTILAEGLDYYGYDAFFNTAERLKIYVPAESVDTYTENWYDYEDKIVAIPVVTANLANDAYWATFYSNAGNYQAPVGTQVFKVALDGTGITLTEITDRIVNAGQGVVLKSTSGSITLAPAVSASATSYSGNSLTGTMTSITNPGNAYVLNGKNGAGFYKLKTTGTIGANKAYLTYSGAGAREFFLFDEATGIEMPTVEDVNADAVVYDLQGRRVVNPTKGLYIVNGKKVFINK